MTTFETKLHTEINENYQGINLTQFLISGANDEENEHIIETFIHSTSFKVDSLRDVIKNDTDTKPYLRSAFDLDKISIENFKKKSKEEISEFLCDLINQSDWENDRSDFAKLLDKYFEIYNEFGDCDFYITSKDWFDHNDESINEPERWIYSYYFIIISTDKDLNLLTISDWTYD